ncbi:hypothetical protein, partial [Virgibacillus sp. DJP39]|uniref:hypothetical protein n=1 Tax=Virgibacillus sp. DJP39 TaxID=3409790 RepID=UPI003BB54A73
MYVSIFKFLAKNALFPFLCLVFVIAFQQSAKELEPIAYNYPKGIMAILIVLLVWTIFAEVKNWKALNKVSDGRQ